MDGEQYLDPALKMSGGRVLSNAAAYSFEGIARLVAAAAVGVVIARYLGPTKLGLLSYVGSIFAILVPIATLGMRPILVREFSTDDDWRKILTAALRSQVPVALVLSAVGVGIAAISRQFDRDVVLIAVALLPLPVLSLQESFRSLLEAEGRVRRIVMVGLTAIAVSTGFKLLAVALSGPLWLFAALTTVEAGVVAFGLAFGLGPRTLAEHVLNRPDVQYARRLVAESWPLLIAGVAVTLYMRADVVMLGLLSTNEATGVYVAAARLSEVWYFVPIAALTALRPTLARLYANGEFSEYHTLTQRFMTLALVGSLLAVALVLVVGDQLIEVLYGGAYIDAAAVLRVHIFSAPLVFLGVATNQWLIDRSLTGFILARSVAGALVNIILNFALIPRAGAVGAAIATLGSYAIASLLLTWVSKDTRPVFKLQMRAFRLAWR